jgi:hypothetical protein
MEETKKDIVSRIDTIQLLMKEAEAKYESSPKSADDMRENTAVIKFLTAELAKWTTRLKEYTDGLLRKAEEEQKMIMELNTRIAVLKAMKDSMKKGK